MANRATTIICYAHSGGGKTTQILEMAKYVYEKFGKKTRLISASGGGWEPLEREGLIDLGIVEPFDIRNRKMALSDVRRLSEGYWPRVVEEDRGGRKVRVRKFDGDDICRVGPAEWKTIGLVAVECLASIASLLMGHIADTNSAEKVGFNRVTYDEAEFTFGSTDKGHVGLVQRELYRLVVKGFGSLPVEYVMFTSLVGKGEDKRSGDTLYGPDSVGTALTHAIPSWVGDCFHLEIVPNMEDPNGPGQYIAWFVEHADLITGAKYKAKVRVSPREVAALREAYPGGYVVLSTAHGIDGFYRFLDKLGTQTADAVKVWKEKVDQKRKEQK